MQLILAILLFFASAALAQRQPPELAEIDTKIAQALADIENEQDWFVVMRGRYAQLLPTHLATPSPKLERTADNVLADGDRITKWTETDVRLPLTMPCAIRVDNYDGPRGKGYITSIFTVIDGQHYMRSIAKGPERGRSTGWTEYDPDADQ